MNIVHLQYKLETGNEPIVGEIYATWSRGQWIFGVSDKEVLEVFGHDGSINIPDQDYIRWLEEKVEELIRKQQ